MDILIDRIKVRSDFVGFVRNDALKRNLKARDLQRNAVWKYRLFFVLCKDG